MSENLTHSEETMQKVWGALLKAGLSEQKVIDVVSDMQNAGILFRERGETEWMERGGYRAKARAALVAAQGAVPDSATEQTGGELAACLEVRAYWRSKAIEARAERDAALAAIERCREVADALRTRYAENSDAEYFVRQIVAALDGAPEAEWEYGVEVEGEVAVRQKAIAERACDSAVYATLVRRRKAGPWEPVEGESRP